MGWKLAKQFQIFKNKSSERYINKLNMIDQETYELKAKIFELKVSHQKLRFMMGELKNLIQNVKCRS